MINEFVIGRLESEKVELRDIKLVKGAYGYGLKLTYRVEDDNEIRDFIIPHLRLPISDRIFEIRSEREGYYTSYTADVGFGELKMLNADGQDRGDRYIIKTIETKTKEMTLEEIEKKLGHKVKIVNKKPTHKKTEDCLEGLYP